MTQETITFNEFKGFITGLIKGKKGVLPDLADWKEIKNMMDKVVPDVEIKEVPARDLFPQTSPFHPHQPIWDQQPTYPYTQPIWDPYRITCDDLTKSSPRFFPSIPTGTGNPLPEFSLHDISKMIKTTEHTATVDEIDSDAFYETGFSTDPSFVITGYAKK